MWEMMTYIRHSRGSRSAPPILLEGGGSKDGGYCFVSWSFTLSHIYTGCTSMFESTDMKIYGVDWIV